MELLKFILEDIYGTKSNLKFEHFTEEVFDYIFLGKEFPKNSGIPDDLLQVKLN